MANKDKILANLSEVQQFAAPLSTLQDNCQKAFKHGFLTRKCVIRFQKHVDLIYSFMQNKAIFKNLKSM